MKVLVCVSFYIPPLTTYRASYLEIDEVLRTIFSIGPVLAQDNDHGVYNTEPRTENFMPEWNRVSQIP